MLQGLAGQPLTPFEEREHYGTWGTLGYRHKLPSEAPSIHLAELPCTILTGLVHGDNYMP